MKRRATDGALNAKVLPLGEFFPAALTDLETGGWNDPKRLEQLVGSAINVTLRDGERTTQDLQVGG